MLINHKKKIAAIMKNANKKNLPKTINLEMLKMCMMNPYSELKTDKIKISIKICTFDHISTAQQNIFDGQHNKCSSVIVVGIYLTRHAIYTMDIHWKPHCLCSQAFANVVPKTDIC